MMPEKNVVVLSATMWLWAVLVLTFSASQVYGQTNCEWGRYGERCEKACPEHCIVNEARKLQHCHKLTGKCSEGCMRGWHGDMCDLPCSSHCEKNTCNQQNGLCTFGCDGTYRGDFCNITTVVVSTHSTSPTDASTPRGSTPRPGKQTDLVVIIVPIIIIIIICLVTVVVVAFIVIKRKKGRKNGDGRSPEDIPLMERSGAAFSIAVDSTVAEALSRKVRLACFITAREVNMETKLKAVNETWGKRCDKMMYVMTTNKTGPDILGVTIPDSHRTLTEKIVHAFTHMYSTSLDEYDWFLKADDDTYVIVENLKFLLAHLNASKPVYVGDHFAPFSPNGYMGGGAGYAVSREALRRLVEQGYRVPGRCRHAGGSEDIETGRCMYKVAVSTYLSLDKYNRSTFHGANPDTFQVGVANFISGFSANKYHSGPECCSQLTISFHYVKPELMRTLDMFLYQITVFGRKVKYKELWNLFRAEEFHIPQERRRRPYPGETIEEYYKNATEWRLKNTTIYIPDKKKPKKKTGA